MDNLNLKLTTASRFEELMTRPGVIVKNSSSGPEYITTVYDKGELIAERVLYVSQAEHFELQLPEAVKAVRKPSKLP
ncbi:hypothetical protein KVP40.0029 [Vibrio phage KVP40]|uniref:Uncharacterized protein n=3 Tax=Schizotequatrovirus KVP40 TaxID=1914019 RepID=Q6WIC2_BPKVM|nr:hypothetical protein KVP40.0029 [Vibrio phage KVP40]AFN37263.1 hypothetical protein pp2_029 [Vibrio phage phi-pp2]QIW91006.1 hypothetical protein COHAPHLL_00143 [Vibrio phage V09]UNA01925.1 hypothetical protein [Vibrio phage PC-Liy1]URQ03222.1 hypothetical protein PVA8_236 [Vibrio phage PVA8]WBM58957.1 hypothetical protein vBValMPVA8_235 [Vibrio phage vB_ValM_PVA8]WOL24940.1 hypothetical protein [Vibrio phage PG216]